MKGRLNNKSKNSKWFDEQIVPTFTKLLVAVFRKCDRNFLFIMFV
jgi:hypothetical protein